MKVLPVDDGHHAYCSGCKQDHLIPNTWQFNGNLEKPTFSPSLLIRYQNYNHVQDKDISFVCHSFITDGEWRYCSDSTHELAGQTVEMEEYE
jgi:hypothetical protein